MFRGTIRYPGWCDTMLAAARLGFFEHREEIRGGIVLCGDAWGDTAMSRLVSLPAAIAARLILEGKIRAEGAVIPTAPEIYRPVLDELEELGIAVAERRTTFHRGPLD